MATAIQAEAVAKFRRLEAKAKAASAASHDARENIDYLKSVVTRLRAAVEQSYNRGGNGRVEAHPDGKVELVVGTVEQLDEEGRVTGSTGGRRELAKCDPNAVEMFRAMEALDAAVANQREASAAASPLNGLVSACRETLKARGWKGY